MLRKSTAILLLLLAAGSALAGAWTSYTNSDDARQITVGGDRVWGATSGGAIAYTLSSGEITKLTNTEGLGGINLTCTEVDTSGDIWFGTSDGWLTRVTPEIDIRNYSIKDSVGFIARAIALFDLKIDGDRLWIASDLGVSKFSIYSNGGEIRDTAKKLGQLSEEEDVNCLEIIGNNLWAGTAHGLAFIDKDNPNIQYFGFWRSFTLGDDGLTNQDIRSISSYRDSVIIGTANGAFKLVTEPDTQWVAFGLSDTIYDLYESGAMLLAATRSGIFQYADGIWSQYAFPGLPDNAARSLAVDGSNRLWAGTPGSGMAELADTSWVIHSIPGPALNYIRKVAIDVGGAAWLVHNDQGANYKGVSRLSNGQWTIFNSRNSDPDGSGPLQGLIDEGQTSIIGSPNGSIWTGSYGGGLYKYDGISWYHWDYSNSPMYGVSGNHGYWAATAVETDQSGNVWVTSLNADSGLVMGAFNGDPNNPQWQLYYVSTTGMPNNYVWALKNQGNYMWVGRGDGIDLLNFNGTPFDVSDDSWQIGISNVGVSDFDIDPSGNLWIASSTGLFYIPIGADTSLKVNVPNEIAGSVNTVACDGVGNIWVGTSAGMGVLRPDRSSWDKLYTTANSPVVNNKINDVAIDIPSGVIYIGTQGGLSVFESGILPPTPDLSNMEAYPNPVHIARGDEVVNFSRVPSEGILTIYTASGDMVAQLNLAGNKSWDLKTSKGERVAGGIYIFQVESGEASGTGKFAIIK